MHDTGGTSELRNKAECSSQQAQIPGSGQTGKAVKHKNTYGNDLEVLHITQHNVAEFRDYDK